jgi:hypothetical protein
MLDSEIRDLVIGVMKKKGKGKLEDVVPHLQQHEVLPQLLKEDKMLVKGGSGFERRLMYRTPGNWRRTNIYDDDVYNLVDLLKKIEVPWVYATGNWTYEIIEVEQCASGEHLVNNIIQPRRMAAWIDAAEGLEDDFFDAYDSDDEECPYNLRYWLVKDTSSSPGFNGGSPTGDDMIAGVDLTDVTGFKNFTFNYAAISEDDFVMKMMKAFDYTKFKSPVKIPSHSTERRFRFYTNWDTRWALYKQIKAQNEDLGPDLVSMEGDVVFKKIPLQHVFKLDEDTSDPIYGVDMGTFSPAVMKGMNFRESDPTVIPGKHRAMAVHVDLGYNFVCVNRRRNFVGCKTS